MAKSKTTRRRWEPRPKRTNFGERRTIRLTDAETDAVEKMRSQIAKVRGVDVEKVTFSVALRTLISHNLEAAQFYADQIPGMPQRHVIDLPEEFWHYLDDCRRRVMHSQGSMYTVMRKLNFDEVVSAEEVTAAFVAVQESKQSLLRLENIVEAALEAALAEAGAEAVRYDLPEAA